MRQSHGIEESIAGRLWQKNTADGDLVERRTPIRRFQNRAGPEAGAPEGRTSYFTGGKVASASFAWVWLK